MLLCSYTADEHLSVQVAAKVAAHVAALRHPAFAVTFSIAAAASCFTAFAGSRVRFVVLLAEPLRRVALSSAVRLQSW
jgi:hypothetical protein